MLYRPDFFLLCWLIIFGFGSTAFLCCGAWMLVEDADKRLFQVLTVVLLALSLVVAMPTIAIGLTAAFTTGAMDSHALQKSERALVKITHINPPKHFYVSFKDEDIDLEAKHVSVSKHFHGWHRLGIGETIAVTRNTVVNRRGWLVAKLSMHQWPFFGRCFFSDEEIGGVEYKYTDVRKGIEEALR